MSCPEPQNPRNEDVDAVPLNSLRNLYDVAEMYFVRHMRNADVAKALGVSDTEVNRLRKKALEEGLVEVTIRPSRNGDLARLESRLINAFRLVDVRLVIDSNLEGDLAERIAREAAHYLLSEGLLRNGMHIGFGAGAPMSYLAHNLYWVERLKSLTIAPLVATFTRSEKGVLVRDPYIYSRSATFIAHEVAMNLRGGPGLDSDIHTESIVDEEPEGNASFYDSFSERVDLIVTGATDIQQSRNTEAVLDKLARLSRATSLESIEEIRKMGATVFASGRFYDCQGVGLNLEFNRLLSAMSFDLVRKQQKKGRKVSHLLVSGSPHRLEGIRACLKGGTVTHLVTDLATAQALLHQPK